jgi:hypothetical protein
MFNKWITQWKKHFYNFFTMNDSSFSWPISRTLKQGVFQFSCGSQFPHLFVILHPSKVHSFTLSSSCKCICLGPDFFPAPRSPENSKQYINESLISTQMHESTYQCNQEAVVCMAISSGAARRMSSMQASSAYMLMQSHSFNNGSGWEEGV